jgi:tRNA-dihydrouridine synthase
MFSKAIEYILSIEDKLPDNIIFYCEYLKKPKHNTLKYNKTPKNNLVLFGVCDTTDKFISEHDKLKEYAELLDIDLIPLIYKGKIKKIEKVKKMLEKESYLGGCKIEGVVVKNYNKQFLLGGQPMPLMAGKYVSEEFKETHRSRWGKEEKTKSRLDVFAESFRTEARWNKAIQHLQENGELENSPKDIGKLLKEIKFDIENEEGEDIKDWLYNEFKSIILKKATTGFPEYYKNELLKNYNK